MNDTIKKLRIVAQVQATLLRLAAHRAAKSGVFLVIGLVFALSAIAIFNLAAFQAMEEQLGSVGGGAVVAAGNLILALVFVRLATASDAETTEERLAQEITEMTLTSLGQDMDEVRDELRDFSGEVRRIGRSVGLVTNMVGGPFALLMKTLADPPGRARAEEGSESS